MAYKKVQKEPTGKRKSRYDILALEVSESVDKEEYDRAMATAMRIVMFADNSKKMLREKMNKRDYAPEVIELVITRMVDGGLINEKPLFEWMAHGLAEKKYFGPIRVKYLLSKKFDSDALELYLDDVMSEIDFEAIAFRFVKENYENGRDRVARAMNARGYDASMIKKTIEQVEAEIIAERGSLPRMRNGKGPQTRRTF